MPTDSDVNHSAITVLEPWALWVTRGGHAALGPSRALAPQGHLSQAGSDCTPTLWGLCLPLFTSSVSQHVSPTKGGILVLFTAPSPGSRQCPVLAYEVSTVK